ncbi:hypothetical protein CYMTET_56058 [Cymbomonas tetramitiformis]|uniref:Uncharacterized protein n=1 Tax=Cymbomonas tetramitiformis TaxID=36881 RepID=A0AAE0BBQ5_9CHLO|nr:hypothetical protein CYMTET_56058 [Cymbomonas tetramitiformis]
MIESMDTDEDRKRQRDGTQGDPKPELQAAEGDEGGGATGITVTPDKETDYAVVGGRGSAGARKHKACERSPGVQFMGLRANNQTKGGKGGGKGAARAREDQLRTSEVVDRARAVVDWSKHPQAPRIPEWTKLGCLLRKVEGHCQENPTVDPITTLEEALEDRLRDPRVDIVHTSRGSLLESMWGDIFDGEREITHFNAGAALSWTNRHEVWPIAETGYMATVGPTNASPQEITEFLPYVDSMLGEVLGEKDTAHIILQGNLAPMIEWAGERARHAHISFLSAEAAAAFLHLSITWIPLSFIGKDVGQFAEVCHTFNRQNRDTLEAVEKGRKRDCQGEILERDAVVLTFTTAKIADRVVNGETPFPFPGTRFEKLADNDTLAGIRDLECIVEEHQGKLDNERGPGLLAVQLEEVLQGVLWGEPQEGKPRPHSRHPTTRISPASVPGDYGTYLRSSTNYEGKLVFVCALTSAAYTRVADEGGIQFEIYFPEEGVGTETYTIYAGLYSKRGKKTQEKKNARPKSRGGGGTSVGWVQQTTGEVAKSYAQAAQKAGREAREAETAAQASLVTEVSRLAREVEDLTGTCSVGFEDITSDIRRNTEALNENVRELRIVAQAWQVNAAHNTRIQENLLDRMMARGGEKVPARKPTELTYVPEQKLISDSPSDRKQLGAGGVSGKTTRQLEIELELLKRTKVSPLEKSLLEVGKGVKPYQGESEWRGHRGEVGSEVSPESADQRGRGKSAGLNRKADGVKRCQSKEETRDTEAAHKQPATRHRGTQEGEPEKLRTSQTATKETGKGPYTQEGDGPKKETSKLRAQEGPSSTACRAGGKTAELRQDATHRVEPIDVIVPPNNFKSIST